MALVAYDDSDISDSDEEEFVATKNEEFRVNSYVPGKSLHDSLPKPKVALEENFDNENTKPNSVITSTTFNNESIYNNIFKSLPKPSQKIMVNEEDDEFLYKKETPPAPDEVNETKINLMKPKTVKISIPSLSEFKDVDNGHVKTMKLPATKPSGLLGMLPQPKFCGSNQTSTSKGLIPDVLRMKPQSVMKAVPKKIPTKSSAAIIPSNGSLLNKVRSLISHTSDESDNEDDENSVDFFSLSKAESPSLPLETDDNLEMKMPSASQPTVVGRIKEPPLDNPAFDAHKVQPVYPYETEVSQTQQSSSSSQEMDLNEDALRQLCGARRKHKKEEIQIIDVDQQVVLADAKEWLQKSLTQDTSKRMSCSKRKGDEPTNQQKRKHQITYLAHQAKANEAELQNQWANNRLSKRQTQSKYGF